MNDDNGELPVGWTFVELGELGRWGSGGTPTTGRDEYWDGGSIPWVSAKDMKSERVGDSIDRITEKGREAARLTLLPPGSVLMVVRGMILARTFPVAVASAPVTINQDLRSITPSGAIESAFLLRVLQRATTEIFHATGEATHGTRRLESDKLKAWPIPVPPLAEQRRIVAAVEAVLAKVNAARERLNRVPAILKRFRQAVLSAACSGRLTADWREKNTAPVSGVEWIHSVDTTRRATAEGQKLRRLGDPTPEPIEELPGWCSTRIGEITECLDHLRVPVKKEHRGAGTVPYYGANGRTGWTDQHLFDEDLVLVVEDESFIGRERPFSYVVRGKSWVNNHAHALRPLGGMSADYLNCLLAFYNFVPLTSGTTGRRKLNQAALLAAPLNVAPLAEQQEIVRRVDKLFALADVIEARLADARQSADRLTQAILAKAFRGELVPTEAELARRESRTYETATELLARIRAEREATATTAKPARTRRPKNADPT